MSTVKNNNKKAAKSGKKVKKTYADVMGIGSVVHNEKVDFVVGLVLLGLAILMMISMVSYFFTGAYDQSLVIQLRPGELISSYDSFQNVCGSFGALVSYFLVARWFGIAAFFIPVFIMFCGLQLMGAYKVNLWKWFFSTALTMVWMSVTFAKFLTPIMTDQVFYPGGDHGENCRQFLEGVIVLRDLSSCLALWRWRS